jgi:hypothetical protein
MRETMMREGQWQAGTTTVTGLKTQSLSFEEATWTAPLERSSPATTGEGMLFGKTHQEIFTRETVKNTEGPPSLRRKNANQTAIAGFPDRQEEQSTQRAHSCPEKTTMYTQTPLADAAQGDQAITPPASKARKQPGIAEPLKKIYVCAVGSHPLPFLLVMVSLLACVPTGHALPSSVPY